MARYRTVAASFVAPLRPNLPRTIALWCVSLSIYFSFGSFRSRQTLLHFSLSITLLSCSPFSSLLFAAPCIASTCNSKSFARKMYSTLPMARSNVPKVGHVDFKRDLTSQPSKYLVTRNVISKAHYSKYRALSTSPSILQSDFQLLDNRPFSLSLSSPKYSSTKYFIHSCWQS